MKRKIYEWRVYILNLSEILFELLDKNLPSLQEKLFSVINDVLIGLNEKNETKIRKGLEELFSVISEYKEFLSQDNITYLENLKKNLKKLAKVTCQNGNIRRMLASFLSGLQEEIK